MSLKTVNQAIERLQIKETSYKVSGNVMGSISPEKVAEYMIRNKNMKINNGLFEDDARVDHDYYWVCVRNQQNGMEIIIPNAKSYDEMYLWYIDICNTSIFNNVNLHDKYPFPTLNMPNQELWSQTSFAIDGRNFIATVFLDTENKQRSLLNLNTDVVFFELYTPWLPTTAKEFMSLESSVSASMVLMHYGIIALLGQTNHLTIDAHPLKIDTTKLHKSGLKMYSMTENINGSNINGNGKWKSIQIKGRFHSNEIERNSGSKTIPELLSRLYLYILLMDDQAALDYEIIQPCKYGYAFMLKSLAGCRLFGSVNMGLKDDESLEKQFKSSLLSNESYSYRSGTVGYFMNTLTSSQLKQMIDDIDEVMQQHYTDSNFDTIKANQGVRITKEDSFETLRNQQLSNTIKQELYSFMVRNNGLILLREKLEALYTHKQNSEVTIAVDDFLYNVLRAHNKEPYKISDNPQDLFHVTTSLIIFTKSLIKALENHLNTGTKNFSLATMRHAMKNPKNLKTFTVQKGLSFLRSCIGKKAENWIHSVNPLLGIEPHHLFIILVCAPKMIMTYFQPAFACSGTECLSNKIIPSLLQHNKYLKGSILSLGFSYDENENISAKNLKKCLLYMVLSGEASTDEGSRKLFFGTGGNRGGGQGQSDDSSSDEDTSANANADANQQLNQQASQQADPAAAAAATAANVGGSGSGVINLSSRQSNSSPSGSGSNQSQVANSGQGTGPSPGQASASGPSQGSSSATSSSSNAGSAAGIPSSPKKANANNP